MITNKKLLVRGIVFTLLLAIVGLFSFFRKPTEVVAISKDPYKNEGINSIYNLLFCDSLELFNNHKNERRIYPWNIIFSDTSSVADLQKIIDDSTSESRTKILACNKLRSMGHKPTKKELLAVIVEVGLDDGLDVLASFRDGTGRYINQCGRLIVWEAPNDTSNRLTSDLFLKSEAIVKKIGPWDKPRLPYPTKGNARITFLVSDGFYFGQGPTDVFFDDPTAEPALTSATYLMKYLMDQVSNTEQK